MDAIMVMLVYLVSTSRPPNVKLRLRGQEEAGRKAEVKLKLCSPSAKIVLSAVPAAV